MKTPEELRQYAANHSDLTPRRIASNLRRSGVTTQDVVAAIGSMKRCATSNAKAAPSFGRPLASLIDQYDDIKKVKLEMKSLPKDCFAEDEELRRKLGIGFDRWRVVVQHPQLQPFRYLLPSKKQVWMHPDAQARLTATINMSAE